MRASGGVAKRGRRACMEVRQVVLSLTLTQREQVSLEVLRLAYEAALEPRMWPDFLRLFGQVLRSSACVMWAHDFSTRTSDLEGGAQGLGCTLGFGAAELASFSAHYSATNVWLSNPAQHQPGTVVSSSALFSDQQLPYTEWYGDWLQPQDLFYSCAAVVEQVEHCAFNVTALRARSVGPYDQGELQWVHSLVPHLKTAFALHRKLHRTQALAAGALALLDRLTFGVLLLAERGQVLYANRQAHTLMQRTQLLAVEHDRVLATTATADQWLQASVAQALRIAKAMAGGLHAAAYAVDAMVGAAAARRLQHWEGAQLHVMVAPLPRAAEPYGLPCSVAVFVSDPGSTVLSLGQQLHSYYRMTTAEAQLVEGLINGLSPQEYAERRGVSINTVRTQLKSAAAKVGVSRQMDLVRAVLLGPGMLGGATQGVAARGVGAEHHV